MITVAIMGMLAAVAIPAFTKYTRRARTSEAVDKLSYLFRMSAAYFTGAQGSRGYGSTAMVDAQFPSSAPLTPVIPSAGIRAADPPAAWDTPTWNALAFAMPDPHYYSYQYDSSGTATDSRFTARAVGDLDGDGARGTFERAGGSDEQRQVRGSAGVFMINELE